MNVLVMGGTRFNGLALVRELVKHGHRVTAFNRGRTAAHLPPEVQRVYGDRQDHSQLRESLGARDFDCIFDLSAYTPDDVRSMAEAFDGRCGHYIFASSTVIYGATSIFPITEDFPLEPEQSDYGRNKIECERYLVDAYRRRGFPASIVPFSMVYGPNNFLPDREQRMIMRLLLGRKILIPGRGTTLNQMGHVEDLARGLRMMMGNPRTFGLRYNLTGKDYYTDEVYVDLHAEALGAEARKVFVPAEVMDELWKEIPGSRRVTEVSTPTYSPPAAGAVRVSGASSIFAINRLAPFIHHWDANVVFSIDRLRAHTGWEPEYTTRSAIAQTCDWFRQEGLEKKLEFDFSAEDSLLVQLGQ